MTIECKIKIELPRYIECTLAEVEEWLQFELGIRGAVSLSNPLSQIDINAVGNKIIGTSIVGKVIS